MDLEAPVGFFGIFWFWFWYFFFFFFGEKLKCALNAESKGQAQAFGSVDQADDRRELSTQ